MDGPGLCSPSDFLEHLTNSVDVLLEEGKRGAPKMMTLALHPRLIGRPGRFAALRRFFALVKSLESDIWVCQRQEVARWVTAKTRSLMDDRHWLEHHPREAVA